MNNLQDNEEYIELLSKAGRICNNLNVFINTLIESGIVSKSNLKVTQDYLREQLITKDVLDIMNEYQNLNDSIENEINKNHLSEEEILRLINEQLDFK